MEFDRKYKFGNTVFRILAPDSLKRDERYESFAVESVKCDYTYEIVSSMCIKGQNFNSVITERAGNQIKVFMDLKFLKGISLANLFSVAGTAKVLPEQESFILHASYIVHEGKAILFCAPSGTGKSTQAHFWKNEKGAKIINEDRVIITKKDGVFYANGCWASGKSYICHNHTTQIKAVVLLAQGVTNRIEKIHLAKALRHIMNQSCFDETNSEQCENMLTYVLDLIEHTNVISYQCVNDISSVEELEKYL